MDTIRAFFYKIRALFFDFQNREEEACLPPPSCVPVTLLKKDSVTGV